MPRMSSTAIAKRYLTRGWRPVPIPHREKGPVMPGWPSLRLTKADLEQYFLEPTNIGVLLGKPSGGLIDIDLDSAEAISLAAQFLPPTSSRFGRPSKLESHWLYYVATPLIGSIAFQDSEAMAADPTMLLELRSTGRVTVFPSSTHPSGEPIDWTSDQPPAQVDGVKLRVGAAHLAVAAALARHWPDVGSREEAALATGGFLLRLGLTEADTRQIVEAAARVAGDEEWEKRGRAVTDTATKLKAGQPVTGRPRLGELLRGDGPKLVSRLEKWLRLDPEIAAHDPGIEADFGEASVTAWPLHDPADEWEFPATASLVETLLPTTGVVWWGGLPKRFKSLLLLYLCLAIACKRDEVCRRFKILASPRILYV